VSSYEQALSELHGLEQFGIRMGLDNVHAYCEAAGHPENRVPYVQVAGTNGKGTTAACLSSLGTANGVRTGCYTSPHLVDFRERITIDGEPISASALTDGWERVREFVIEREMTFFEATTLIAIEYFADQEIDVGVLEVGLGGRLDATAIVKQRATVITNIALDHQQHLGEDLVTIAGEKAGTFKPGVLVFVGDPRPPEVRAALTQHAARIGAPIRFFEDEVTLSVRQTTPSSTLFDYAGPNFSASGLTLHVGGDHFALGAGLALWVWEVLTTPPQDEAVVRAGLEHASLPGRAEWRIVDGVPVLFDVAHNEAAIVCLVDSVQAMGHGRAAVVAGILADKPWTTMLDRLQSIASRAWLCDLETAPESRRMQQTRVRNTLGLRPWVRWSDSIADGLERAMSVVRSGGAEFVLVTGSFHTVGEALVELRLAKPGTPYAPKEPGYAAVGA
jgi:dihydrofolate synthase/folylpolyglutamate synthase